MCLNDCYVMLSQVEAKNETNLNENLFWTTVNYKTVYHTTTARLYDACNLSHVSLF